MNGRPLIERLRYPVMAALRQALETGVRWGYMVRNPAKLAGPNPMPAPREIRVYTTRPDFSSGVVSCPGRAMRSPCCAAATSNFNAVARDIARVTNNARASAYSLPEKSSGTV